jgi:hypothetical protein
LKLPEKKGITLPKLQKIKKGDLKWNVSKNG